jgi:hypothetical protein
MSGVRVLLGACKGAFVLTSAAMRKQWEIAAPHFPGWEIFHLKGSPGDPSGFTPPSTALCLGN